jgi:hypothetical protein
MTNLYLYTGATKAIAEQKAIDNLALVNEKCIEITSEIWGTVQQLISEPIIDGNQYFYGFQSPPPIFINGSTCDLEAEFDSAWFQE